MSDKQKGLIDSIQQQFPRCNQRHCCRHLYANFRGVYPGAMLRTAFWTAAKASTAADFQKAMGELKDINVEAHDWLMRNSPASWARHAFDHGAKSDHVTNNMTESFNQWIAPYRDKPIVTLIDQLRVQLMTRFQQRYATACSLMGTIIPAIKKKLDSIERAARGCTTHAAGLYEFEVNDGNKVVVVKLDERTCTCKVWEATGLPCKHAAHAIAVKSQSIDDYCDPYYTVQRYQLAYGEMIHAQPDTIGLSETSLYGVVQPPFMRRRLGRPNKNRRRAIDEGAPSVFRKRSSSVRCSKCNTVDHNKRTCKGGAVKGKGKRKRGGSERMESGTSSQGDASNSQRQTRSNTASTGSPSGSVQERVRSKMTAYRARRNSKFASSLATEGSGQ
ncbi:uncharacterized protein LOC122672072 [Telopea speciosissima]|uniref:uncharacterized protein LOC122672072 n=1 Tax=Telopea speciosissima TaxID=54955 RepID=UPI001CC46025|nr:uncharacterized protein LOC122672072 [Telopea speciosissima]